MKRTVASSLVLAFLAAAPALVAQSGDVNKVLADTRKALGGETKLAAVKTFAATGQAVRVVNEASQAPADFEMAFELPDRFMKKDVVQAVPGGVITRTSGFNGDRPINVVDQPPSTGGIVISFSTGGDAASATPEQQEQQRQRQVLAAKQELARITAGMLLPLASYPLQFAYAGQAESPDGKADVVDVTGEGGFAARLFIDASTHLPLMLSWMGKEPIRITIGGPGGRGGALAPGAGDKSTQIVARGKQLTPEERDTLIKQTEEQRKAAEANARTVEYRIYYSDYRDVDGVKVPFKLQRSIDGKPTEELTLENVKVNGKVDEKKFEVK